VPSRHLPSFPPRRSPDLQGVVEGFARLRAAAGDAGAGPAEGLRGLAARLYRVLVVVAYLIFCLGEVHGQVGVYAYIRLVQDPFRSEEHTSELQSRFDLVC